MPPPETDVGYDYWGGGGGIGSPNSEVCRMERTVAAWPILAEVANSMSCNRRKIENTSAVGKR